jgi:aminoglycoside phosphotransferase (APT) family kinase protein
VDWAPADTAPVREGEGLPWDRLEAYLAAQLGVAGTMRVRQFPNGSANLTYFLSFSDGPTTRCFVLRRPPFGLIAPGAHDMKREYRVLSRLWRSYDRAPRAFVLCEDHDLVGSDFVVSEYRTGVVVWAALPPSMAALPEAGHRIGLATVDALADLHLVDPQSCRLETLGRAEGFVERQLNGWRKRWELVATPNFDPTMSAAADALFRSLPRTPGASLVHNDFKTDNCQFAEGDPDRVRSVFDWDMATLGDPLADLGTMLNYWPDPSDTPDDRALHVKGMEALGFPSRAEVVERYALRTGSDLSGIGWYEAFACWKTSVVLQQLHQRYVRGESTDVRMADKGDNIEMLANRALRILSGA